MSRLLIAIAALILLVGGISYYTYTLCTGGACPFEWFLQNNLVQYDSGSALDKRSTETTSPGETTAPSKQEAITPGPLKVLKNAVVGETGAITPAGVTQWTNTERVQGGLSPLIYNPTLAKAAAAKVDDMFAKQYFEHDSPTGVGVDDLATEVGYAYIVVGENLAMGNFKDDEALVRAWMESPGHRANIMKARFQEIGVAARRGTFEGREVWLAVQEFGRPLSSCPSVNPSLKNLIEINKEKTESLEVTLQSLRAEIESMQPKHGEAYNQKVNEYNALVGPYNELVKATRELVNNYNAQVKAFNECVTKG